MYDCTCCGGETEDEHKIREKQLSSHVAQPLPALGSGLLMTPTPQCFFSSLFDAIAVSNASPSSPHAFSFTVSPKLKEKAGFAETIKPSELPSLGDLSSQSREVGSAETAAGLSQCLHTLP